MNRIQRLTLLLSITTMLLLAACGGTAETPTPEPAAEPAAADTNVADTTTEGTQTFTVVTAESQASYIVNEEFFADALDKLGINPGKTVVTGTTPGVTGEITLNFDNPELVEAATFTVDMSQLTTDQNRRDNWLRDNAIQTGIFPEATFVATSASGLPETITPGEPINFQLTGDLTVREVTKEVTFDVTATLAGNTISGTATLGLNISDMGITPPDFANTLTVSDPFTIEVVITAQQS